MDKAIQHLDLSIKLYFEKKEYSAVILLAGSSEELIKAQLIERGIKTPFGVVKFELSEEKNIEIKEVAKDINRVKTWLKHGSEPTCKFDENEEALQMIIRAIAAFQACHGGILKEHFEFIKFLKDNRPDLYNYNLEEIKVIE